MKSLNPGVIRIEFSVAATAAGAVVAGATSSAAATTSVMGDGLVYTGIAKLPFHCP